MVVTFDRVDSALRALMDSRLGHLEARLAATLCLMARSTGRDAGCSWPYQTTLATGLGCSVRSVGRAVDRLRELGLVTVIATRSGNVYRVERAALCDPFSPDRDDHPAEDGYGALLPF